MSQSAIHFLEQVRCKGTYETVRWHALHHVINQDKYPSLKTVLPHTTKRPSYSVSCSVSSSQLETGIGKLHRLLR